MASDSFSLQNFLDTLHRKQIKESEEMESKTKGLLNEVRLQFYLKQNTFFSWRAAFTHWPVDFNLLFC